MTNDFSKAELAFMRGLLAKDEDVISQEQFDKIYTQNLNKIALENGYRDVNGTLVWVGDDATKAALEPVIETATSLFRAISVSINDTLAANLSALAAAVGLSPPHALPIPRASGAVPDESAARAAIAGQAGGEVPNWLLWPPRQTDPASSKWEFYLDWFATSTAPEHHPALSLLLDGEVAQGVALDTEDAGRFFFELECGKPTAFALTEDETGALRLDIQTV